MAGESTNIESLNIRINASATKASTSLDKLRKSLVSLRDALAGFGNAAAAPVATINDIATAAEKTEEKAEASAASLGKMAKQLKEMGLEEVAHNLKELQKDVNLKQNLGKTTKELDRYAAAFEKIGDVDTAKYLRSIDDPVAANEELRAAKARLEELKQSQKAAAKAARDAQIRQQREAVAAQKAAERASQAAEKAAERARIAAEKQAAAEARAAQRAADRAATNAAKADAKARAEEAREAERQAKAAEKLAKEREKEAEATRKAAEEAKKLAKAERESRIAKLVKPIKTLASSIARIGFYRAIRTAIKSVTDATKEGLTNLKAYSDQVGTAFAPAVDNLRRHVLWLKNAFATALRPAIEAIIPIIMNLVNALVKAADFVAQVTSVLFGKTDENGRYTKAVLGDLEDSNKQAKELRRTLLGFDEINRLDGDTGSGSSKTAQEPFVLAEVSPEAMKVAEFIQNIPWDKVLDVLKVVGGVLVGIKGIKLVGRLKNVWDVIKKVWGVVKKVFGFLGLKWSLVIAGVAAAAKWGDVISEKLDKSKKEVDAWFDNLKEKTSGSKGLTSLIQFVQDVFDTMNSGLSDLSLAIYKLFHADFKGALKYFLYFLVDVIYGAANIVVSVLNIVLGAVSDLLNGILYGLRWLWNDGIQPVLDAIVHWVHNEVFVPIDNTFRDLLVGFLYAVKDTWNSVAAAINKGLEGSINAINGFITWVNDTFGTKLSTIPLEVLPYIEEQDLKKIEDTKLKPIPADVTMIPKWEKEPNIDLTIKAKFDSTEAKRQIDKLFNDGANAYMKTLADLSGALKPGATAKYGRTVSTYASGGFPTAGSLFIAGEGGGSPEYVGSFGGQTGVWNSDQLVSAMFTAFSSALAANPQGGGDIYLDGEVIYKNTVRRNNNAVRSTGRSALLT